MLKLAPDSTCDICTEPFDGGSRKPCSTTCGHIFCLDCFCNIPSDQRRCPQCRSAIGTVIELHLDVDDAPQLSHHAQPSTRSRSSSSAEVNKLLEDISTFGRSSGDSAEMQRLLARCHTFLQFRREDQFKELRLIYRLLRRNSTLFDELQSQHQIVKLLQEDIQNFRGGHRRR